MNSIVVKYGLDTMQVFVLKLITIYGSEVFTLHEVNHVKQDVDGWGQTDRQTEK